MAVDRMERLAFNCGLGRAEGPAAAADEPGPPQVHIQTEAAAPERDRLAYRALLAFMVVLLTRPQDTIPFLAPLHLAELTGVVALLALVAGRLSRGAPITSTGPEVIGVLALAGWMVATVPLSFWPGGSFNLFKGVFVKVVLIFLVTANVLTTRERVQRYITVLVLGGAYVGARAVFDYARGVNLVEGGRVAGAVGGLFGNPNDMALNMATFLPFAVALALYRGRPVLRLLGGAGAVAMALALVFSKSRGGTVGLIAMMVVLLYHLRRPRPGVTALVVVACLAVLPLLPSSFTDRMASILDAEQDPSGSREARKTLLREGWETFLANPLTGVGLGQFTNYNPGDRVEAWRQTHNAPLQVASELGIVGVAIFLWLVWIAFSAGQRALQVTRAARRRLRAQGQAALPQHAVSLDWLELHAGVISAAVVGWFVAANFASVAYYWTFYLILALGAAVRDVSVRTALASQGAGDTRKERRVAS